MINGMTVSRWACINFSRSVQESVARGFCNELAQMCQVSGMVNFCDIYIYIFGAWFMHVWRSRIWIWTFFFLPHVAVVLQEFNPEPVIPIYNARPEQVEKALKHVYHASMNKTKGKELELLLAILPDNNGSLYGMSFMIFWCLLDWAFILIYLNLDWNKVSNWRFFVLTLILLS